MGHTALGFCGERDLRVVDIERMVRTGEQGHHLEREEPWMEEGSKLSDSRGGL